MAASDVSSTRLYLGNLTRDISKEEIQEHFASHGAGTIKEVKLMNGFGFIEYDDAMDARDVVPDGSELKGQRLTVQFARGPRPRESFAVDTRPHPRPRRTQYRMQLTGLAEQTSWQDLKDFARRSGSDVVYSEVGRERDGRGFVEFETSADLKQAVEKLDGQEFKGSTVHCLADEQAEPPPTYGGGGGYRGRSRSPSRRGAYGPPSDDSYYRSRGPPPRGYSPRRYDQRPPSPRDYYARGRAYSPGPPPVRGPPRDEYPPARRYHREEEYPPPSRRYGEPYPTNGYEAAPPRRSPPPAHYGHERYDRPRAYW